MTHSDNPTSLIKCGTNNNCKKFYSTDSCVNINNIHLYCSLSSKKARVFIRDKLCGVEVTDKNIPTSLLKYRNNYNSIICVGRDSVVDVKQYLITSGAVQ